MPINIQQNIPLAPYTMFKIGGLARYFIEVKSSDELQEALQWAKNPVRKAHFRYKAPEFPAPSSVVLDVLSSSTPSSSFLGSENSEASRKESGFSDRVPEKNIPFFILGAGSNTLVSDEGFDGLVIRTIGGSIQIEGELMTVDAGVMMARAVIESAKAGLSGFEWGIGVPGTIGGSVRGNAGCFGGEMKDVVESVEVFDTEKDTRYKIQNINCEFGYRHSIFKKHPEWVILSATLKFSPGNAEEIQKRVRDITIQRTEKQAIGTKCAGCVFKNISWNRPDVEKEKILERFPELQQFADRLTIPTSFLIDHAGLKGTRNGPVVVSEKHANFFLNEGGATAEQVRELISTVKGVLQEKYDVMPEEEIQYLGFK